MTERALSVIAARCERETIKSGGIFRCRNRTRYVVPTPHGPIHDCGRHP